MPLEIGALTLPVAAGAQDSAIDDLAVKGIADFLAFTLRTELDAKLANMRGTSSTAVAAANVRHYDPATYHVREAKPSLYVWWGGRARVEPLSLVYDARVRDLNALWVFDELVAPTGLKSRYGLLAAADAAFAMAAYRGRHDSYGFSGAPNGTPIAQSVKILRWDYTGGEPGFIEAIPAASANTGIGGGEGAVQRAYPALRGTFTVWERIISHVATASDLLGDGEVEIETGDTTADTVLVQDAVLEAPDGTEID